MAGEIRDLRIPKKGHAIIEYHKTTDALRSVLLLNDLKIILLLRALIMLRNQNLNGRKMMIKMDGAPFAKHNDSKPNFDDRKRMRFNDDQPRSDHRYNDDPPRNDQRSYDQYMDQAPRDQQSYPPPSGVHQQSGGDHYDNRYSQPPPPSSQPQYRYQEQSSGESYSKKVCLENLPLSVTTATIR